MNAYLFTFLEFELNLRSEVLKKSGTRLPLASQPLKLLSLLVRRAGDLVTREEIQKELWTKGSVVDFDHLVNQYIRQLRAVLGDNRESPIYIETAPRRGYRFIAPVSVVTGDGGSALGMHTAAANVEVPATVTAPAEVSATPEVSAAVEETSTGNAEALYSAPGRRKYFVASMAAAVVASFCRK